MSVTVVSRFAVTLEPMSSPPNISSFIVRVMSVDGELNITLQNIGTRRMYELSSWGALLRVLQEPSARLEAAREPGEAD